MSTSNITHLLDAPWMHHRVYPVRLENNILTIATDNTSRDDILQAIQFHTGYMVNWLEVNSEQLDIWRNQNTVTPKKTNSEKFSVKVFIENLMQMAIQQKISDIHFEPYEKIYRVRFRRDGLLQEIATAPLSAAAQITAYLKVMAHLDTSEHRLPQDGRFHYHVDCRISTCPTVNGEKVVVRLLHASELMQSIETLGFNPQQQAQFIYALSQPQGLILVTGPTGSGKTVTLYTALQHCNAIEKNIVTVEDPVEVKLPGINQVGINSKAGLTFAKVVRAFLRQDPDIILIGEIRDRETAEIALHAAQTGHLVLATLHANNAVETLHRLVHLGLPLFQIADAIQLIIAQRLVRKLCHDGYQGRIGIFEMLSITPAIAEQMRRAPDKNALETLAAQSGMLNLRDAAHEKIAAGLTSIAEVERVMGYTLRT